MNGEALKGGQSPLSRTKQGAAPGKNARKIHLLISQALFLYEESDVLLPSFPWGETNGVLSDLRRALLIQTVFRFINDSVFIRLATP